MDKFENDFAEYFKDLEPEVNPLVWDNISSHLEEKKDRKKRRALVWFYFSGAAATLLFFVLFQFNTNSASPTLADRNHKQVELSSNPTFASPTVDRQELVTSLSPAPPSFTRANTYGNTGSLTKENNLSAIDLLSVPNRVFDFTKDPEADLPSYSIAEEDLPVSKQTWGARLLAQSIAGLKNTADPNFSPPVAAFGAPAGNLYSPSMHQIDKDQLLRNKKLYRNQYTLGLEFNSSPRFKTEIGVAYLEFYNEYITEEGFTDHFIGPYVAEKFVFFNRRYISLVSALNASCYKRISYSEREVEIDFFKDQYASPNTIVSGGLDLGISIKPTDRWSLNANYGLKYFKPLQYNSVEKEHFEALVPQLSFGLSYRIK